MKGEMRYSYREAKTFMHQIDPVSKLVWLICLSVLGIVIVAFWVQVALLAITFFTAIVLARIPVRTLMRTLRYIFLLGGILFVMQSLFVEGGTILWHWGPLVVHERGVELGATASMRIITLAASSVVFLVSTSPRDLAISAADKLGLPTRATQAIFLALRFLPLLEAEYKNLSDARRVRGASNKSRPGERIRGLGRFVLPYLHGSLRRAQMTALAMDAKAFGAFPSKSFFHQVQYPLCGKIWAGLWVLLLVVGIYLVATGRITRAGDLRMA
jgi:energy-coupling factor transport system permease protein